MARVGCRGSPVDRVRRSRLVVSVADLWRNGLLTYETYYTLFLMNIIDQSYLNYTSMVHVK